MKKRLLTICLLCCILLVSCTANDTGDDISLSSDSDSNNVVSDQVSDSQLDSDTTNTVVKPEPLTDTEKSTMYANAGEAAGRKNYQYAYGLYMRLAAEGYSDSAQKAAELRMNAYARPVAYVNKGAFHQLSDTEVLGDGGCLYLDEQGTPKYMYAAADENGNTSIHTLIPDPSLKNVKSIVYSETFGHTDVWMCLLLKGDGTLAYFIDTETMKKTIDGLKSGEIADKDGFMLGEYTRAAEDIENGFIPFVKAQKDVVYVDYGPEDVAFVCLKSDGTVSAYGDYLCSQMSKLNDWENVVEISVDSSVEVMGLDKDGNILYTGNTNVDTVTSSDLFMLPSYYKTQNYILKIDDGIKEGRLFMYTDGTIEIPGDKTTLDVKDHSYIYTIKDYSGYNMQGGQCRIDTDGNIKLLQLPDEYENSSANAAWLAKLKDGMKNIKIKIS